jgi:hypothetical protein
MNQLIGLWVIVKNGKVQLWRYGVGLIATFSNKATFAIISGDHIQVNLQNGKTEFYKLSKSGNQVSGPFFK